MTAATGHRSGASERTAAGASVECTDLVVRYGSVTAVDVLTFSARAGEVVAILGPNGAGKTSTLEVLMGYRRPSGGRVRVHGLDPVADHRALTARIGVMLQKPGLYTMLGPRQAIRLFAGYYADADDPETLLDLLSLGHVARTPWRHLSGGEQQRLSLALALVGRPDVLFLDEPTSGVDPQGRQLVREVIKRSRNDGATVLLTTHELAEAEKLADRVLILHRGTAIAEGTTGELARDALPEQTSFGAPPGLDVVALSSAIGATVDEVEAGRYVVRSAGSPRLTADLTRWLAERDVTLSDLSTTRSLEEIYLSLVGDREARG